MPIKGDKLYACWNGTIEMVTFIEESLSAPDCTETTYLVRGDGALIRVSKDMFQTTVQEAYQLYWSSAERSLVELLEQFDELRQSIEYVRREIQRVQYILSEVKPDE